MKTQTLKDFLIPLLTILILVSCNNPDLEKDNSSTNPAHVSIDEFPKDMVVNHIEGWGGMTVAINELPSGADLGPLLEGLKNNSCQAPHWGYIIEGALRLKYDNGKEEVLKAGDVFYMPPGHTAVVEKNLKLIDFSPQEEFKEVVDHIEKKIAASKSEK